jgi:hypothetical protein
LVGTGSTAGKRSSKVILVVVVIRRFSHSGESDEDLPLGETYWAGQGKAGIARSHFTSATVCNSCSFLILFSFGSELGGWVGGTAWAALAVFFFLESLHKKVNETLLGHVKNCFPVVVPIPLGS